MRDRRRGGLRHIGEFLPDTIRGMGDDPRFEVIAKALEDGEA